MSKRLKYVTVDLHVSDHQTLRVTEPVWVLPILVAIHSGKRGKPEVVEDVLIEREAPDAEAEYARLSKRYRNIQNEDGSKGVPYCVAVYGAFGIGNVALAKAIADAVVELPDDGQEPATPAADGGIGDLLGGAGEGSSVGG